MVLRDYLAAGVSILLASGCAAPWNTPSPESASRPPARHPYAATVGADRSAAAPNTISEWMRLEREGIGGPINSSGYRNQAAAR